MILYKQQREKKLMNSDQTPPQPIPLFFLLSIPLCYALQTILPYDNKIKVYGFGLALLLVMWVLDGNGGHDGSIHGRGEGECARTAGFLVRIVCGQIVCLGMGVGVGKYFVNKNGTKLQQGAQKPYKLYPWKQTYTMVITTLLLTSMVGLVYSIHTDLYVELLHYPELPLMLVLIGGGFGLVGVGDWVYARVNNGKDRNEIEMDVNMRRKIFHFVPVGLLPGLVRIHYRLFTLMVFGAFYLFWVVELCRYFGKLARGMDKQQQSDNEQLLPSNKICKITIFGNLTNNFHAVNKSLSRTPLIQWMQSLNSSREPYFWFTHLSLILGLSLTYIYYQPVTSHTDTATDTTTDRRELDLLVRQNVSVMLVLADAMAAIVGRRYGRAEHRIPYTNKKTLEGYLGFVGTAALLQFVTYLVVYLVNGINLVDMDYFLIILSSVFCGVGELFSGDLDNVVTVIVYLVVEGLLH